MSEETLVAGTQVVQPGFVIRRPSDAVLWALTVTHVPDITRQAVFGQAHQFGLPE